LAGIVVGGTSILGGDGAIWRTVVGVLIIALTEFAVVRSR
jgi:ribose transport system permease protein